MKQMLFLSLVFLIGCGSLKKSTYKPKEKNEGYWDSVTLDGLKVAGFRGNQVTKKEDAESYAHLRAIEQCRVDDDQLPLILTVEDKTQSRNITRGSSFGYPSYYYGMSPYYGRYSGFGVGFQTVNMDTWEETQKFPVIEVQYMCLKTIHKPQLEMKDISGAEMKLLVKDLRGAVQIVTVPEDSPNAKTFEDGDLILRADGKRVETSKDILKLLANAKSHELLIDVLREGENKKGLRLRAVDVTENEKKHQQNLIDWACQKKELKDQSICRASLSTK